MPIKHTKIKLDGSVGFSGDTEPTIVSTIQPIPSGERIVKIFSSSTSSADIVEGSLQEIQDKGYRLEPTKVRLLVKGVEDIAYSSDSGQSFLLIPDVCSGRIRTL